VKLTFLWKVSYPTPHLPTQLFGTSTVPPPQATGTTPLGLESATATSERKSTDDMTVRIGHTGHAGSVHPFFLQPSLRHRPEDLFPHMWTVHTHILKMDYFARIGLFSSRFCNHLNFLGPRRHAAELKRLTVLAPLLSKISEYGLSENGTSK